MHKSLTKMQNQFNKPMLLPERFPKMLPLNGGFRYPASVRCVTVSKMHMVMKIINEVTDRVANIMFKQLKKTLQVNPTAKASNSDCHK